MNTHLLSVEDLSEILNVPRSWVYARTRETGPDSMPRIKVGKYLRFELEAVMGWLKDKTEAEQWI